MRNREKTGQCIKFHIISIIVFICSCVFQIAFNTTVTPIRSIPDEMGAIYLAAQLSGHDWSYVMTHPAMFYGYLWLPLIYPLFKLISNPYLLYQYLLGTCAIVRSVPVFISGRLIRKYYKTDNALVYTFLILLSVFATPTRSTTIDNEPLLVLLCWLIFATVVELLYCNDRRKRIVDSVLLSLYLGLSMLAHTRAIIFYVCVVCIVILVWILCKKIIVHIPSWVMCSLVGYVASKKLTSLVLSNFYPVENTASIPNTTGDLAGMLTSRIRTLLSAVGLSSYADSIVSNLLGSIVFGLGIPYLILSFSIYSMGKIFRQRFVEKKVISVSDTFVNILFPLLGLVIVLLGVGYNWLDSAISIRNGEANVSGTRGYFYLRYYGMFFAPLLVAFLASIKTGVNSYFERMKKHLGFHITLYFILVLWLFHNYIGYGIGRFSTDWFYLFAPFSFGFEEWPRAQQTGGYYYLPFILTLFMIVLSVFLLHKNRKDVIVIMLSIGLLYQYGYSVIFWDSPFSHGDAYYYASNGIYSLNLSAPFLNKGDQLYCYGTNLAIQYNVQFVLPDVKVINDYPDRYDNDYYLLLVTNNIEQSVNDCSEHLSSCDAIFQLDDNEYLWVRGNKNCERFRSLGLEELDQFECIHYCS